jgi:copper chaperone CopZ
MRATFLTLFILVSANFLKAQFKTAEIGVDGLTCSACTNATEQSLLKLDFVDYVDMDLNANIARVTFKPGKLVDLNRLSAKVFDAGFSVRSMLVTFTFTNLTAINEGCFVFESKHYLLLNATAQTLNGDKVFKVIGKKMMPKKEFNHYKPELSKLCGTAKPDYYVTFP